MYRKGLLFSHSFRKPYSLPNHKCLPWIYKLARFASLKFLNVNTEASKLITAEIKVTAVNHPLERHRYSMPIPAFHTMRSPVDYRKSLDRIRRRRSQLGLMRTVCPRHECGTTERMFRELIGSLLSVKLPKERHGDTKPIRH